MKNTTSKNFRNTDTPTRRDIRQQVTDTIIQQLENGTVPWQKPWVGDDKRSFAIPKNFTTGNKYRGINILLLWASGIEHDYPVQEWASYKQWQDKKEAVRKGEKGSMIVYYDTMEKEENGEIKKIPFLKSSVVFNCSQLVSYNPDDHEPKLNPTLLVERIKNVEDFVAKTGAIVEYKGSTACYIPSEDKICMPLPEAFIDTETSTATEGYYSTLLHELTHWTGSEKRLNREGGKKFGDKNYATEELVADIGAAFLCAELEITATTRADHANYIANWLKALKDNKDCIITAASEASKAVTYLQDLTNR
jgi:antirestriction protein ArdC